MNVDQKVGVIALIFGLIIWFLISIQVEGARASIYPRFTTVWIIISSVFLIIQNWKGTSKRISYRLKEKEITRVIVITIMLLIYFFMIDFLGFYIASFSFLIIVMLSFGVRDWRILILIPPILLLFLYFLIEKLLFSPLPKGRIF